VPDGPDRFPKFWVLQLSGWAAFAGVTFVDLIPRSNHTALVAYEAVFVAAVFPGEFFYASGLPESVAAWTSVAEGDAPCGSIRRPIGSPVRIGCGVGQ
jgi:hypothetical protein